MITRSLIAVEVNKTSIMIEIVSRLKYKYTMSGVGLLWGKWIGWAVGNEIGTG